MKVEKTDKPVAELPIPSGASENPMMIETPGVPMGAPKNATQPQGVPAPVKAASAPSDIVANKPPVALPC